MSVLLEYKCPCCGGKIEFNSETQKMKCPYCETSFDVETLKEYDDILKEKPAESQNWDGSGQGDWRDDEKSGLRYYSCSSCGGEIVGDATTAATSCPYCGNPIVMSDQLSGMLRPDCVIPFKLSKENAKDTLKKHIKGKILLPKEFKTENRIDKITGVYIPFWLFDCDVDADIRYKATKTRAWSDSRYNYIETSHFMLERGGTIGFEKVPVDGSKKMDDLIMESIEPFDYSDAVDFQTAYLAGYLADKYDVDAGASAPRANERIKNSTVSSFGGTVNGYSSVTTDNVHIDIKQGKIRYALLPVWLLSTSFKGKIYTFAMNGQTGRFVGDLPMSLKAFWLWFLGLFAGGSVICGLLGSLFL